MELYSPRRGKQEKEFMEGGGGGGGGGGGIELLQYFDQLPFKLMFEVGI